MAEQNRPIPLEFVDNNTEKVLNIGFLYYGDSILINRLQWLPYLEIGAVAIFIILGFAGFTLIRNSEKDISGWAWLGNRSSIGDACFSTHGLDRHFEKRF